MFLTQVEWGGGGGGEGGGGGGGVVWCWGQPLLAAPTAGVWWLGPDVALCAHF